MAAPARTGRLSSRYLEALVHDHRCAGELGDVRPTEQHANTAARGGVVELARQDRDRSHLARSLVLHLHAAGTGGAALRSAILRLTRGLVERRLGSFSIEAAVRRR